MIHKQDIFPGLIAAVLFLTVCAYLGAAVSGALGGKTETVEAIRSEYSRSVQLSAIVIRNERPIGAAVSAFGRCSGEYIMPSCDGYEYLSADDLENFSWQSVEELMKSGKKETEGGRAIKDYAWYYAAKGEPDEPVSGSCRLRFEGTNGTVSAAIVKSDVSPDGESYLLFRLTADKEEYFNLRFAQAELVFSVYSGLEVPQSAVAEDENGSFVFVDTAGYARRTKVDIIYSEQKICLAAFSADADALHEGDSVVRDAENMYEGKILS